MSELNNGVIEDTLKIIKEFQKIKDKYGKRTLATILNNVGGFFGLVGCFNPESVDKKDLEEYKRKNPIEKEEQPTSTIGSYESDKLEDFGLYQVAKEREAKSKTSPSDTSIYAQDPGTLEKVQEDRRNHSAIKAPTTGSYENNSPVYDTNIEKQGVRPVTRVLEDNPWASAGNPVSPGQIEF